jgi:hypothetical protein
MPRLPSHEQGNRLEYRELGAVKVARPDLNERGAGQYLPSTQPRIDTGEEVSDRSRIE